ncbi:MAG: HAD-IIIA family hydrolase [Actinobacteria bacterium]|nr:HAD-IIIA family hydrolase [Actinomycetota bacterium]
MLADSLLNVHEESLDGRDAVLEGSNRVVLLDRDGVLNVDRPGSVTDLDELEVEAGAAQGAALLARAGFALVVVTNQACVGRGALSPPRLDQINRALDEALGSRIRAWFVCPHAPEVGCRCRKPGTLLLEQAHGLLGFDPAETWFVLDAGRDIEAARRFGCHPALVRTGKGRATEADYPDVPVWDDLLAFARWLTSMR